MTANELEDFLGTDDSKSVGDKGSGGESTGHQSGRRIVKILRAKKGDLPEDDAAHMRKHDRGAARVGAVQVQPVPTNVDQLARHWIGPGVERLAHGLVAAANRGDPNVASIGYISHRALRLRSCRRARKNAQTTSPNRSGGHTQLSTACTAADLLSEARPASPMNAAGAAAHRCGWSLNRTESTANNAHPSATPATPHR